MAVAAATPTTPPGSKHNIEAMREAFYARIAKKDMAPLWKVMKSVVTDEPVTRTRPHVWHYGDVKSLVMESGGLITAAAVTVNLDSGYALRILVVGIVLTVTAVWLLSKLPSTRPSLSTRSMWLWENLRPRVRSSHGPAR